MGPGVPPLETVTGRKSPRRGPSPSDLPPPSAPSEVRLGGSRMTGAPQNPEVRRRPRADTEGSPGQGFGLGQGDRGPQSDSGFLRSGVSDTIRQGALVPVVGPPGGG